MLHVQSCAKKNSLTDDTVRSLIRQEVAKAIAEDMELKKKNKANVASKEPEVPKTFMEAIVNDTAPKKKCRRPEVLQTVRSLTETRGTILESARMFLKNTIPASIEEANISTRTQAFAPSKLPDALRSTSEQTQPPTQIFGESALGKRVTFFQSYADENILPPPCEPKINDHSRSLPDNGPLNDDSMPPPTPRFAPSKLFGMADAPVRQRSTGSGSGVSDVFTSGSLSDTKIEAPTPNFVRESRSPFAVNTTDNVQASFSQPSHLDSVSSTSSSSDPAPIHCLPKATSSRKLFAYTPSPAPSPPTSQNLPRTEDRPRNDGFEHSYDVHDNLDNFSWNDDNNVYLHHDMDTKNHVEQIPLSSEWALSSLESIQSQPTHSQSLVASTKKPRPRKKSPERLDASPIAQSKKAPKYKGKQRMQQDRDSPEEQSADTVFEAEMQERIISNDLLHLRILRFEVGQFQRALCSYS